MFDIDLYDYALPAELIAQAPAPERDHSRLLVADRRTRTLSDHQFHELPGLLERGDLLVVNDTRVVPARLHGFKDSGGRVEVLVLECDGQVGAVEDMRRCLIRASKPPRPGGRILFRGGAWGEILEVAGEGLVTIRFGGAPSVEVLLEEQGRVPLPPYIRRHPGSRESAEDRERYQTVYARVAGAVAAPTAGLHFTKALMEALEAAGIGLAGLTLHVGHGTFAPVRSKDIRKHRVGGEWFAIGAATVEAVRRTRQAGRRVVAVGTTVVRALETAATADGLLKAGQGRTELMIVPGHCFRVVDAVITNFHLPRSSLLFLVAAFAGLDFVKTAYRRAVERRYRFYSYGDAMLIV